MDFREFGCVKFGILRSRDTEDNFLLSKSIFTAVKIAQAMKGDSNINKEPEKIDTASNFDIYADSRRREEMVNSTLERLYGKGGY